MPTLSGSARLAGIAGWPVAHSRSPRIHGFWLGRYSIDGAYVPLCIRPERFEGAVRGLMAAGFAGINVTIPHKRAAFEICDSLDEAARRSGAVNTMIFRNGNIEGSNTDGFGFLADLRAHGVDPVAGPVLILGAGGAARALAASFQALGVRVTIANRSADRAKALARDLAGLEVLEWQQRSDAVGDQALVVNTTPLGMSGYPELEIDLSRGDPTLVVADIVYVPLETRLLRTARTRNMVGVNGLGMLLYQACPGFAAWFGTEPVVDEELRRFVAEDLIGG
jgi:shikimate dehydrogenase